MITAPQRLQICSGPLDRNATLIEGDVAEAVRRLRDEYESIISHAASGRAFPI